MPATSSEEPRHAGDALSAAWDASEALRLASRPFAGRQPLWPALLHASPAEEPPVGVWAPASCYLRCLMQQGTTQELLGVPSEALLAFKEGGMLVGAPVLACMCTPVLLGLVVKQVAARVSKP